MFLRYINSDHIDRILLCLFILQLEKMRKTEASEAVDDDDIEDNVEVPRKQTKKRSQNLAYCMGVGVKTENPHSR